MNQTMVMEDSYRPDFPSLGLFSTWFGAGLIGLTAVLQLSQSRNQFWADSLMDGLQFVLVALVLASLIYLTVRTERGVKWAALPLAINLGTLMIVQFVPFADLGDAWRFRWRISQYQAVVQLVESGVLLPEKSGEVALPEAYRHLSVANGRIWVEGDEAGTAVFFVTEQNGLGNFSGYLYRSDNKPPRQGDFFGSWHFVEQQQPNWFFCISQGVQP
ncbi:MAG: hypothetical protein DHS20C20_02460 [Ardenticatenaceae bacterium]|nr:MAG: hypothetical protein DHS20C20_02460 [Ardenticatenaceae bacterium]